MSQLSTLNSTAVPLGASGVFQGQFEPVLTASAITVLIHSDRPSATNGIVFEWSSNGVSVDDTQSFSYAGAASEQGRVLHVTKRAANFRIRYTNTSLAQTTFRMQTILRQDAPQCSIVPAGLAISDQNDALVTNSVLVCPRVDQPATLVYPRATADPFLITARPPNSSVVFTRNITASLVSQQLDFFGIIGANRDAMSVHNDSNGVLLLNQGAAASPTSFVERIEPGETWHLPLSWILYGGTVHGIWLPPDETAGPIKFARVNVSAAGDTTVVPAVASKRVQVLGYLLTSQTANAAVTVRFKSDGATVLGGVLDLDGLWPVQFSGSLTGPAFETAAGEPLVLNLSAAKAVEGHLSYVEVGTPALSGAARVLELS